MIFANEAGLVAEVKLRRAVIAGGMNEFQWCEKLGRCGTKGRRGHLFYCQNGES